MLSLPTGIGSLRAGDSRCYYVSVSLAVLLSFCLSFVVHSALNSPGGLVLLIVVIWCVLWRGEFRVFLCHYLKPELVFPPLILLM